MYTLPQPGSSESEARPVSEILAKANPAEMPAMRASLSFLTSAGAELATALARRNEEYDRLMAIVSTLPPEWVEAAQTGRSLPDVSSLRAELELAKDERVDLRGQIAERDQRIKELQENLDQLQSEGEHQDEIDAMALAKAQAEDDLKASEAELNDIESRLASLRDDLSAALSADSQEQAPAAPDEEPVSDPRQRRAMRLGALAAAISALIDRNRQNEEQVNVSNVKMVSVLGDLESVSADRMALEADLQEKVQTLEDQQTQLESLQSHAESLNAQIEQLTGQTMELQAELENTLAAKTQLEEQLQLREGELAELNQQIDSVGQQLRGVLPEDLVAELAAAGSEEPAAEGEEPPVEGEEPASEDELAARSAAPRMLGLGALAAGVAAAVDLSNQKTGEAEQASSELAAALDARTSLESALSEKEQAIADLNAQIETLNAQTAEMQAQLEAALALKASLEEQASERDGLVSDLQGQVQEAVSRLQEIVPTDDLPQPEMPEAVEGEGEAVAEEAAVEMPATRPVSLAALVAGVAAVAERNTSSIAELAAQIDGLSQEKTSLETALAERERDLAGYNDYSLNLQGQVNELAAQVTSVEAALAVKEQAEAEAQAQVEALNAQIGALNSQVEALTAQIDDLQAQLDAVTGSKAELEQTLQATQAQLDAAQADLAQIEQESERALGSRAVGLGAVGAGVAAVSALKEKEAELAEANSQLLALQGQVNELASGNADVAALNGRLEELASAKADVEAQLAERDVELDGLRSQLATLQEQQAAMVEESAALQAQLVQTQEDVSGVDALRSAALSFEAASTLSEALARLPAIKTSAASAAIVAGVQPALSTRIQALTDVAGIGSAYQQRLYNAGIGTYWELSSLPDADLETILQIPELQRARIDFEETRADAYQWAQKAGTIGLLWDGDHVDDFESLPGVGKTFEKRLYEAGITTYEQLLECDIERLKEIIKAPPMREVDYGAWKERAQQLLAERQAGQPAEPDQPGE
jgi:chromosome segregation ATPase